MAITPQFLEQLKDRLPLSDIIAKRLKLVRAGREYKACCPFHKEKSPSFYVNNDKGFYHCFGCGAHGDVVGFTMAHDNLSFIEAVEALVAQAGMQMPQQTHEDIERAEKQKSLYAVLEATTKFYEAQLHDPRNKEVLAYIRGRGFRDETIASFRLGYSPQNGEDLRQYLLKEQFTDGDMIEAGLFKTSQHGGAPYAFFRDRLMFPVADKRGRVVAFGGRVLPESIRPPSMSGDKPPKYINSAETPLFHKGHMVYAESHARAAAAQGQPIVVVEGYLDVIACNQAGIKGAVAPLGTALTEDQMQTLWRGIPQQEKNIILCFDGDNAGRRAAERAVERALPILKPSHSISFVFLPDGEDPDTFVQKEGVGALQAMFANPLTLLDMIWNMAVAGKNFATPESRAGLAEHLDSVISPIADSNLRYHFRKMLQEKQFASFRSKTKNQNSNIETLRIGKVRGDTNVQKQEFALLGTLYHRPDIWEGLDDIWFNINMTEPENQGFFEQICTIATEYARGSAGEGAAEGAEMLDISAIKRHLDNGNFGALIEKFGSPNFFLLAPFARQNVDAGTALAKWRELYSHYENSLLSEDIAGARQQWAATLDDSDSERLLELQRMRKGQMRDEG